MSYYFDKNTNVESKEIITKAVISGKSYTFKTDNNVFSKKGLDFGTRTLLESLDIDDISGDVLDFGCGYGPIGIYIKSNTSANVDMLDINERALKLARENAGLNKVEVNVFESDLYSNVSKRYDYIVSNPPIRVGKEILYKILFSAKEYLKENGQLWIVVNKNQGAKTLAKELEKQYKVKIVCKNKGFFIICATNN